MTEENKKTIIAFIAGLLVGGLLVFIFANPTADTNTTPDINDSDNAANMSDSEEEMVNEDETPADNEADTTDTEPVVSSGEGEVEVNDQAAGSSVSLDSITFPTNGGWVGVREYENGQLTGLLGVARWNQTEGLLPSDIRLLRPTIAGNTYAVVFYTDNGDKTFSLATDVQMEGVMETFEAE